MANRIVLKKSTTAGAAPSPSDLVAGELAINTVDGGLFTRLEDGSVYTLVPRSTGAITNQTIAASLVTPGTFPTGSYSIQNLTVTGTLTATASAATTATKLSSNRTLALTGDVTGSVSSDLDTGFSITTTLATVGTSKGGTGLTTTPGTSQVLVGQTNGSYALRTLTAGTNITITEASGNLTFAATGGSSVTVAETAPSSPSNGDLWWDSNDGVLNIYYVGAEASQWVDVTSGGIGGVPQATVLTTTTTAANQVVESLPATSFRSVKYFVQISSGSAYAVTELLVVHDGTTAYVTEYGTINTGSALASFSVDINSGNLRLLTTPTNANTTIKAVGTKITT